MRAVCGGLQFFLMSWAGQHVLRNIRSELFRHLHRLSLGYYAQHEAGAVMSRITNDTDTLQQALSFARELSEEVGLVSRVPERHRLPLLQNH